MTKTVTIDDILKSKSLIEEKRQIPFISKTFGGEIEIEDVPPDKIARIINSLDDEEPLRGDYELIYECCPIFRSKELQIALGVNEPLETVEKAFGKNINEIDRLAKHIIRRYGYFDDTELTVKKP